MRNVSWLRNLNEPAAFSAAAASPPGGTIPSWSKAAGDGAGGNASWSSGRAALREDKRSRSRRAPARGAPARKPLAPPWMQGMCLSGPGGRSIYLGALLENEAHAHYAIQVSIALEHTLSLQAPPDRRWRAFRAVAAAPDQPHRIRARGPVAQIYLDPESAAGLALRQKTGKAGAQAIATGHLQTRAAALRPRASGQPDADQAARFIDTITGTAARDFSRNLIDPRVQKTLTTVHALPGRHASLRPLAGQVALAPSRLGALFRRDIGIPLRRYLLWLRLIDAIAALARGANLTRAAHDVGFSDSAHFSRTFHRMFGMPPSALQSQHIEIHDLAAGAVPAPWWSTHSRDSATR
jgi:AraC family transcriptional regulator